MTVIIPDNKIRNVKLTGDEIEMIVETLKHQSYEFYKLYLKKIIKKLDDAKLGVKEQ